MLQSGWTLKRNEVFLISENRWDFIPQMECKRKYPSALAMSSEAIYLFGGCMSEEVDQEYIECFNPTSETWSILDVALPGYMKQLVTYRLNSNTIMILGGQKTD